METALEIAALVAQLVPNLMTLVTQAKTAAETNDQAALDSLLAQAEAAANALAPAA